MRHFPFAKKRQACFDFFFFFAAGASAAAGAAAAGAAAVASSERFNIRTVGVALLLRAAARAAAQALVAAIMSNAKESCASITASEGMDDGEPCDCCFCLARRGLLPFPFPAGAMVDAVSLASAAGLPRPVRAPGGSAIGLLRSCTVLQGALRGAHQALSHTRINHLPRRRARSRSVRQQDWVMSSMHR